MWKFSIVFHACHFPLQLCSHFFFSLACFTLAVNPAIVFHVSISLPSLANMCMCIANCIHNLSYTQKYHPPDARHYKVNNLINSCSIISTQKLFTICIISRTHHCECMTWQRGSDHHDDDCIVGIKIIMFMRLTQISNYDYSRGASGIEREQFNIWMV